MTIEKRPEEWAKEEGVKILDPDGWRMDNKDFDEPITKTEFNERLTHSTIIGVMKTTKEKEMTVYRMWLEPFNTNPLIMQESDLGCILEEIKVLDEDDVFSIQKTTMLIEDFKNLKEHPGW